ncbi:MAG: deoxynucleoside kinase [Bacteroidales bacterium]|nr:deoxynucleoside kinase [Bacteroidales bacterium]
MNCIVVEGNIGAGKTTFAELLANKLNVPVILEQAQYNPYLPLFYMDKGKYAFPLELTLLIERFQQFKHALNKNEKNDQLFVCDYGFFKSIIFAEINLTPDDFEIFKMLYKKLISYFSPPKLVVFLNQSINNLITNISHRGRIFESNINEDYLKKISISYEFFFSKQKDQNILVVDLKDSNNLNEINTFNNIFQYIKNQLNTNTFIEIRI